MVTRPEGGRLRVPCGWPLQVVDRSLDGAAEASQGGTHRKGSRSEGEAQPLRPPSLPGPQPGETAGRRPLHYPADVQPVWDKHCLKCHAGKEPKNGLDLSGTPTMLFSVSYESLVPERRRGKGRRRFELLGPTIGENHPKTANVHYPARLTRFRRGGRKWW